MPDAAADPDYLSAYKLVRDDWRAPYWLVFGRLDYVQFERLVEVKFLRLRDDRGDAGWRVWVGASSCEYDYGLERDFPPAGRAGALALFLEALAEPVLDRQWFDSRGFTPV